MCPLVLFKMKQPSSCLCEMWIWNIYSLCFYLQSSLQVSLQIVKFLLGKKHLLFYTQQASVSRSSRLQEPFCSYEKHVDKSKV